MATVLLSWLLAAPPGAPDTIVVCPPAFSEALEPWMEYRQQQGHRIAVLAPAGAPELKRRIKKLAAGGKVTHLLLVGDAPTTGSSKTAVPTSYAPAKVNVKWGSEPQIATDNDFANLDDDIGPELAVGRLTADSPAELSTIIEKIIAYERSGDHQLWRRRINFVAGVGGFGQLVDSVVEMTTKKFLTDGIPPSFQTSMTYGSWRSPFCPSPVHFHETTLDRLNEGCLFWIYIGHGQKTYLDRVQVPGSSHHIFSNRDVNKVKAQSGMPIAVFLACYTGAFDQPVDCLAEDLLRKEGGPVAVLSGSRVTMPYAMAVMGTAMMDEYFQNRPATLGEVVVNAKRRMLEDPNAADGPATPNRPASNRQLLDGLAAVISPAPDQLAEERKEHVLMFNLLGDPLLRLNHPAKLKVLCPRTIRAAEPLTVMCNSNVAGTCTVELVCRRDMLKRRPAYRKQYVPLPNEQAMFDRTYEQANDRRWTSSTLTVSGGEFQTEILVPQEASGPAFVRLHVEGEDQHAMGAAPVTIHRAE